MKNNTGTNNVENEINLNGSTWSSTPTIKFKGDGVGGDDHIDPLKNRGITLIALIITIILMLILTAVVINVTVGENGLFKTAKKAAMDYKISEILEKLEVEKANLIADMNGDIPSVAEYINYLIGKDIITEADVTDIDDNTKEIVVDKYMFLVEKEENGNIKITYNGIATTDPKIGKIEVVKTTGNSISIKVIASNVDNGDYKYYIKNITTGEEYKLTPTVTLKTNEYTFTGLAKENKYKIKVELVNEKGTVEKETDEIETVPTRVQSVTLNKSTLELEKGATDTSLIVTVSPDEAEDKSLTWTSSDEAVAKVSVTGGTITITAIGKGTATITATSNDGSGKSASCELKVKMAGEIDFSWEELGEIAKIISDNYGYEEGQINEDTEEINVSYKDKNCNLRVGDWTTVNEKKVRILGFNHDDLVTGWTDPQGESFSWEQYGEGTTNTKAGISFEYVDFLMNAPINTSKTTQGGWGSFPIRSTLNSVATLNELENRIQIKQVKKQYIKVYNDKNSLTISNDYLWLLSCSEIWNNGELSGGYGLTLTKEGERYKYYKVKLGDHQYDRANEALEKPTVKRTDTYQDDKWFLRSHRSYNVTVQTGLCNVCSVQNDGGGGCSLCTSTYGIAPGFAI